MADLHYSHIASEEMDSSSVLAEFELYNRAGIFDGAPSNYLFQRNLSWIYSDICGNPEGSVATQESYGSGGDRDPPTDVTVGGRDEGHEHSEPRKQEEGDPSEKIHALLARRRSQNRDAQRAYRQRKIRRIEELERQLGQATERIHELMAENQAAEVSLQRLAAQNARLKNMSEQCFRSHLVHNHQGDDLWEPDHCVVRDRSLWRG
ncbi:hypothetical protein LTS17_009261 [Exophiala oligosperma]